MSAFVSTERTPIGDVQPWTLSFELKIELAERESEIDWRLNTSSSLTRIQVLPDRYNSFLEISPEGGDSVQIV